MASLRDLLKLERGLEDSLSNLEQFVKNYKEKNDQPKIDSRLERLENIFKEFRENRAKIEARQDQDLSLTGDAKDKGGAEVKDEADQANKATRLGYENRYFDVKDFLVAHRSKPAAEACSSAPPMYQPLIPRIHLPVIKIPSFDGNVTDWLSFRDTFQSLIEKDASLSPVDKFNYLLSVLTKEARALVETIEVTDKNYEVAWQLLTERFENHKIIARTLMDGLLNAEPIRRESYDSLVNLIDTFERNLLQLKKIGLETDEWSPLLAHLLYIRLDVDTQRQWERFHKSREAPLYDDLLKFLRNQLTSLQPLACLKVRGLDHRQEVNKPPPRPKIGATLATTTNQQQKSCPFCQKPYHSPFKCESFSKKNPIQRHDDVRKAGLCLNCLSFSHMVRSCPSLSACRVCGKRHHTMLHLRPLNTQSTQESTQTQSVSNTQLQDESASFARKVDNTPSSQTQFSANQERSVQPSTSAHTPVSLPATASTNDSVVFLSTAVVKVADYNGNTYLARALLDCCSERNLISERMAQKLVLRRQNDSLSLQGVGPSQATSKQSAMAKVFSRCTDYTVDLKFHILPELKLIIPANLTSSHGLHIPSKLCLADPRYFEPNRIDLIIGAEIYYHLLLNGFIEIGPNLPVLKETVFGWIVSGKCSVEPAHQHSHTLVCSNTDLEQQVARFWELELCRSDSVLSAEERRCEEHFVKTTVRDATGRFIVSLPKKESVLANLGESRAIAERRFSFTERRLQANPALQEAYAAFIIEYIALDHMVLVDPECADEQNSKPYYMPHHGIEKPDSLTTKLRVVFDASCATDTGVSLNDALMVGAVVQDDLFTHVLRFRLHRYVYIADIEKMYRQILVDPADRHLQRILYRANPSDVLQTYELRTVTYGTASAPFLATRCLKQLASEGESKYPQAAQVLANDFYMDDLLSGAATESEAITLCHQLIELLQSAGFKLYKWASNSATILQSIPPELRENRTAFELDSSSSPIKTLGLLWHPVDDSFLFKVPKWNSEAPITKRLVLSDTARLFDPQGFVGPVILRSKIFIQRLWKAKVSWDVLLNDSQQRFWREFREDLEKLNTFSVPRWAVPVVDPISVQLHGFCDASESGYGAVLYLRTESSDGTVVVRLLTSKSRVASCSKQVPLPRLELCGGLLLAHLFEKVEPTLPGNIRSFFWTDSMLTIHWLASSPARWKKFVGLRVSEMQEITARGIWGHVPGVENPADVISRGMSATQLIDHSLWWQGPTWLSQPNRFWPSLVRTTDDLFDKQQLEEKPATSLPVVATSSIFTLKSTYKGLTRTVAYILRFCFNARGCNRAIRRSGPLSVEELDESVHTLVKLAQMESFPEDLRSIRTSGQVKPTSKLKNLSPILVDGILRVRGRLRHAAIPYEQQQPMILDNKHPFTAVVLRHYHEETKHAEPQLLIAAVRSKFWPLRVRDAARMVVHKCMACFRLKCTTRDQLMADLPKDRVTPTLAFLNSGVDFCGPFYMRPSHRKAAPQKSYVAVFVCMSTKAVHLELVGDLSADSFIAALRRFTSRRGYPKKLYCDNGTNFVGARRILNEFLQLFRNQQERDNIIRVCADDGIQFKFIPPRTPNFGGLWEAAVKSLKTHLRRTVGNAFLTAEQFVTLLTQVEACLNSRPLTPLSNNPEDLSVLTPGHFLVHRPLIAIPEPSYEDIASNRLSQWQMIQEYLRRIWNRWSTEYLADLQQRTRWTRERDNIRIGTMVLVREDRLPPQKWQIGRVVEIFPGDDNLIRVVGIWTKDGTIHRGITRICVLPIEDNEQHDEHSS